MNTSDILNIRVHSQLIEGSRASNPHDVVAHLLAMQAQDYAGATWAIGLRLPDSTLADVERALADGGVVRTWPMRGTLHFLAAEDVHWLLALLTPRILARAAARERQLELDAATFDRARELFSAALVGGRRLTRPDAMALLEAGGVSAADQRGYHIVWRLAQEGLLVVGPMESRQQTFRLLAEWVPAEKSSLPPDAPREELTAALAARYFHGHGPATVDDLARWAGITKREAAAALDAAASGLESGEYDGARYWFAPEAARSAAGTTKRGSGARPHSVQLLPGFDEYMLGYIGRGHQLGEHLVAYGSKVAANGMLAPTVVVGGRAIAIWKRKLTAREVTFALTEFQPLTATERAAVAAEEARYARFMGRTIAETAGSG